MYIYFNTFKILSKVLLIKKKYFLKFGLYFNTIQCHKVN